MIAAAALVLLVVLGVGVRALPRPLAEMLVDLLYAAAQRAYAAAVAADRALVAYRTARRQAERETVREYKSLAAPCAGNETPAAGVSASGAAVASGCPAMEVA